MKPLYVAGAVIAGVVLAMLPTPRFHYSPRAISYMGQISGSITAPAGLIPGYSGNYFILTSPALTGPIVVIDRNNTFKPEEFLRQAEKHDSPVEFKALQDKGNIVDLESIINPIRP
jgi:hypothetical protein